MPYFKLSSNVNLDEKMKSSLVKDLSELLAKKTGGDSYSFIFRQITEDESMVITGDEPMAEIECEIPGEGNISFTEMKTFSRSIGDFLCNRLNIADERVYFDFSRC